MAGSQAGGAVDARDVSDFTYKPASLNAGLEVVRGDVLLYATPRQYVDRYGTWHKGTWALLVSTDEVLVCKKGLLGLKTGFRSPIANFLRYAVGLQGGHGPLYEVSQDLADGGSVSFLFLTSDAAEATAQMISDAVGGARDPDFAQLNRSMQAARSQPPGDLGETLTPEQVTAESRWMRQGLAGGSLEEVWARRVTLGYSIPASGSVAAADRFWLNAAPALAALRLGRKDHPMVAMCCGVAESDAETGDADHTAVVREFNRLYHG